MRIDTGLHMRMEQRMKLAPRMIQSMEILQLPTAALEERIEQELANNPTLEQREAGPDPQEIAAQLEQEQRDSREGERELVVQDDTRDRNHREDFERLVNFSQQVGEVWEDYADDAGPSFRRRGFEDGERDPKLEVIANAAARPASLTDQLLQQWRMAEVDGALRAAGELIISHIDDDGYLRTDLAKLLEVAGSSFTLGQLEQALALVQRTLEPVGIGARDLRECLLLQIDAKMRQESHGPRRDPPLDLSVERLLVDRYLKDIEANRLPKIVKETNLTIDQINAAKRRLRQFQPHPGRLLAPASPQRITPDAVVEYDEVADRYVARLTNDRLPSLQINRHYLKMARDARLDKKTRDFVGQNLRSARWLLDAIRQRNHTLLRVINVVIQAQREFFDMGPQYLRPLPMTSVADQLGIHVATVSRAVNEKYLQTPRGIFPLRMFFSGGTATQAGEEMSWTAVQAKLEELIKAEDKAEPLSDDQLVQQLKAAGIDIARRTVAKYRKQLRIPPARQRKQY